MTGAAREEITEKVVRLGAGMAFWGDRVQPAIEMVERLFKFIKAVAVLNDRLQARDINSPDKILQRPAMSHANPLNDRRFQQQLASRQ